MLLIKFGIAAAFFAVLFGAFGAHALPNLVPEADVTVFRIGVRYQMWHALGVMILGVLSLLKPLIFHKSAFFFLVGMIVFSGGLYLYELTQLSFFAMIVPVGGLSYMLGWVMAFKTILTLK